MENDNQIENKIKTINVSLSENIINTFNKIGKEKLFEDNLIKILKKLLQIRIKDLNKKILLLHEKYLKEEVRDIEPNKRHINKSKVDFKEKMKKQIEVRNSFIFLFQDLQKFIQGKLTQTEFESHIKKYPNPSKRQSIIY